MLCSAVQPRACVHVQETISALQYNHTNKNYFDICKNRPLCEIIATAQAMLKDARPIKCVEAVFLAILLTTELKELDRFPIGFKTRVQGKVFRCVGVVHKLPLSPLVL